MGDLFTLGNLMTLGMLTLLQAVLGFDNLLYISIESKRVPEASQAFVRKLGIGLAVVLRIVLLYVVMGVIETFQKPFYNLHLGAEIDHDNKEGLTEHLKEVPFNIHRIFDGEFNVHSIIVMLGGAFILYTALKEIYHMLSTEELHGAGGGTQRSVAMGITMIVLMNLVFSFDSILSALALTKNFSVMATAIIIGGLLMIVMSDHVTEFLKKNRMYEVLGLFILFIVGVMLVSEGGHLAHIHLFGHAVTPMAKSTFYFVLAVLVIVDIVQGRYQKKLLAQRKHAATQAST